MPRQRPKDASSYAVTLIVGLALLIAGFSRGSLGGLGIAGLIVSGIGLVGLLKPLFKSRQLPKKEVMRLAEQRGGLLTLSEIATALDIDPDLARRTLQALSKDGLANQRWQEYRKNLWEFPDYMTLPLSQSIDLAKSKGGRLSYDDLLASGHSPKTARDTLDALADKGLAQQDPSAPADNRALIVTTQ